MSEAQQESRLKVEVDPSTIIPEYRERVAHLFRYAMCGNFSVARSASPAKW
ncbi:hypothetical protein VO226_05545 [Halomonas elongata]|uniref:hypothetical protein n=1 Tax=Halomonas elongata TaxID=2746 RepID=UPI002E28DC67|nr:hypothetical protein [Halomonas elongata]WVI72712.1 hypothetical protein VO226_05545 [Halomonas elongata]